MRCGSSTQSIRDEAAAVTVLLVQGMTQIRKEGKTWNRDQMDEVKAGRSRSGEAGEK